MEMHRRRVLDLLCDAILDGKLRKSSILTSEATRAGISAKDIISTIQKSMAIVGKKFEKGEYFLPEVLCSADSAEKALEVVAPLLNMDPTSKQTKIVVGTVKGDIHDIGKNILVTVLRSAGHQVQDLGTNVSAEGFISAVGERKADFLLMSALTTTTMLYMKNVIDEIVQNGVRDEIMIIIGGGPVTEEFAVRIGADGYGKNAFEALAKINALAERKL